MLRQFFKYFNLSRTEQNGFFVLCTLILLLFSFSYIVKFFNKPDFDRYNVQPFTQYEKEATTVADPKIHRELTGKASPLSKDIKTGGTLFHFDPNRLEEAGWLKLGFTDKQVKVILNYRKKGGKFYKKEDLAKIYSISPAEFKRLENFIDIQPTFDKIELQVKLKNSVSRSKIDAERKFIPTAVDINSADTTALITLRGIGSTFAKRIVKYRESLGGFVSVQQIKEVYGLPPETFEAILPYLKINSQHAVSKLAINVLDVKALLKHPYINFKQSTAIVNYRMQHGDFKSVEDLKKVILLEEDFLRKLAPYLTF